MALISCPECGKEISEYAEICLGCGCPMRIIELLIGASGVRKGIFNLTRNVLRESGLIVSVKELPSEEYMQIIEDILSTLTPREEKVIIYRYGLKNGVVKSYEEIGRMFGVPFERVNQIEHQALRKLREPFRIKVFLVMQKFPLLESLKKAAEQQGFIKWTEGDDFLSDHLDDEFNWCCFELLNMYDPTWSDSIKFEE